jgi:hypothetical protein
MKFKSYKESQDYSEVGQTIRKPFLLRVSIVIRPGGTGSEEIFFEEVEGCFLESRGVLLTGGGACSEAPSTVSSTNLDESHNVRNLDVPSLASALSQPTLSSSPRKDVPKLSLKATIEGGGSWPSGRSSRISTKGTFCTGLSPL